MKKNRLDTAEDTDSEAQFFEFISEIVTLTEEERNEIRSYELIKSYKKNAVLLREGEYSNKTYLVIKGLVRSYYLVDGEERTTAFYGENEPISPTCAISKEASAYYLTCVEDTVLSSSDTEMEEDFFEKFPRFEKICRIFAERMIARKQMVYEHYINSSPEQRYLFLMQERPDLLNRIPQYHLASFLGIKPESLSRIKKRIAKK